MSSRDLTLFSYEILGLVGRRGAGAHDLKRMVERGRLVAWAGESQYYVEPKRLARLGYLDARKEPGRTRQRTVYRLTQKGHDALRAWAETPARILPLRSEVLQRLLVCDLVGEPATRAGLADLRAEIADLRERLAAAEASAEDLPHRRRYLLMATAFMRGWLDLHEQLADTVDRELADG